MLYIILTSQASIQIIYSDMPDEYQSFLQWCKELNTRTTSAAPESDPLLSLRGSGKHLWADEHTDESVRRLREDWE